MSSYSNFHVDLANKNSSWTIIYNQIKDGASILDVGCSSGYFDEVLINDKHNVIDGVELDENDAERAAKVCRKVVVGNVEHDDFPWSDLEKNYDYILFIDVLEHLLSPSECLKKIARLLKPNGKIIFSIPNMANGSVRLQLLQGNFDYEKEGLLDETHLHYYTLANIQKMVSDSGLKLVQLDTTTFDVPKSMISEVLDRVGLKNTKEFTGYLGNGDSLAYQFIGTLAAGGQGISSRGIKEAIKPKMSYEKQLAEIQADSRRVFASYDTLNAVIKKQQKHIDVLEKRLNNFEKWSGVRIARKAVGKVKGSNRIDKSSP